MAEVPVKVNWGRWAVRVVVMVLLLLFLLRLNLNFGLMVSGLLRASPVAVLASVALIYPILVVKSWRWRLILANLKVKISFSEAYHLYALGLSVGSFTPGQAGDAIKAWPLKSKGYSLGVGLVSVILDRLFDVVILLLLAGGSLFFLGSSYLNQISVVITLLGITLIGLLVLALPALRSRLAGLVLKLITARLTKRPYRFARGVRSEDLTSIGSIKLSHYWQSFCATLVTCGLAIARTWLLALALGLNLNLGEAIAVSSLATVAALVPISISGIGVRDFTLISLMGKLGYSFESALELSTLILMLNLVNLLLGYLIWVTRSKNLNRTEM
jgi:uncharacterized protein (TIRG00374 family)